MKIILASSSSYRKKLLSRILNDFECVSPAIDETPQTNEAPSELAMRLSIQKAESIARKYPDAWVIGSDQVALFDGKVLGKPGTLEIAKQQLFSFSDKKVEFITGVSLIHLNSQFQEYHSDITEVHFKKLSTEKVTQYLAIDTPYDCAGSFKVESFGICLFNSVETKDPTALEGLPLIALTNLFENAGIDLLSLSRSTI
ncbi:nucleoside triphosphate pyrophosphatase [Aliikangiella sp. G2MR2-5]|uniref:Maf family protein n=1 Tax=Aliikangiella sp. G2MR2-5 TaxID=2788943 RepID=UPI0018A9988C|nr:Maf family nucleotide pyrophosphatase [Aliikangiella sp. G2MR2-5]